MTKITPDLFNVSIQPIAAGRGNDWPDNPPDTRTEENPSKITGTTLQPPRINIFCLLILHVGDQKIVNLVPLYQGI